MIFIFALLLGVGVVLVFWGWGAKEVSLEEIANERLALYRDKEAMQQVIDDDLRDSFAKRVLFPLATRMQNFLTRRTPEAKMKSLRQELDLAGRPMDLTPAGFQILRYGGAVAGVIAGGLLGFLVMSKTGGSTGGITGGIIGASGGFLLGFFFPVLWLRQKKGERLKTITRTLPDAMDLILTCVESGMGFDSALAETTTRFDNALGTEFGQVVRQTKVGMAMSDALEDLSARCNSDDIQTFVLAVNQAKTTGTGLGKILRIQSGELRRKREERAEQKAAQAPLKMLFPMVGCIFPVIWIILLGPAVMVVLKQFGH